MSITLDRPVKQSNSLRQLAWGSFSPNMTGSGLTEFEDFPFSTPTRDSIGSRRFAAIYQIKGSFVPAVPEEGWLEAFLRLDSEFETGLAIGEWGDYDILFMEPLFSTELEFEILSFTFGQPSPFGLEE